mmetsp:Transcript_7452/g.15019  ORF Transcript_7452/g.15019 Transcript_7452/m.15019 type:complete len:81 (+) Transcript_7452:814-1056(+)
MRRPSKIASPLRLSGGGDSKRRRGGIKGRMTVEEVVVGIVQCLCCVCVYVVVVVDDVVVVCVCVCISIRLWLCMDDSTYG